MSMYTCCVAQGKGIFATYRSPFIKEYGVIWAPTIHDERITSMETLESLAKQTVEDNLPKHLKEG